MRIDLGQLALAGLALDLARDKHLSDRIVVHRADGISGKLFQDGQGFELTDVRAPRVQLDFLQLSFGTLTLAAKGETVFEQLECTLSTRGGQLEGRVFSLHTRAIELVVHIGSLHITAEFEAEGLLLELRGSGGSVQATQATFRNLVVESSGAVRVLVPLLRSESLKIGWGEPVFNLSFVRAEGAELELTQASTQLRCSGIALRDVEYQASALKAGSAKLERVEGNLTFAPAKATSASIPPEPPSARPHAPLWDEALLDHLSGNLNVDVEVDIAVPIIGHRRATHELRVPITDGSLDYLVLESGLSRLEDSLLDFAVREGALVLEVGIPLVGVRGRGKPLVIWDLSPEDYRLAERNRVRLAVLPKARLSSPRQSEPPPEPGGNGNGARFALRHMTLANIDTDIAVSPQREPMQAALRELAVGTLHVQGAVHHDPDSAPRAGLLRLDADRITAIIQALPVAHHELGLSARLSRMEDATLRFEGTRLTQVTLALTELELDGLAYVPPAGAAGTA